MISGILLRKLGGVVEGMPDDLRKRAGNHRAPAALACARLLSPGTSSRRMSTPLTRGRGVDGGLMVSRLARRLAIINRPDEADDEASASAWRHADPPRRYSATIIKMS